MTDNKRASEAKVKVNSEAAAGANGGADGGAGSMANSGGDHNSGSEGDILSGCSLSVLATLIAVFLSSKLNADELTSLASFLSTISSLLFLNADQMGKTINE